MRARHSVNPGRCCTHNGFVSSWETLTLRNPNPIKKAARRPAQHFPWDLIFIILGSKQICLMPWRWRQTQFLKGLSIINEITRCKHILETHGELFSSYISSYAWRSFYILFCILYTHLLSFQSVFAWGIFFHIILLTYQYFYI